MNSIGIIGFGRFGQLAARYLKKYCDVCACDKKNLEIEANRRQVRFVSFKEACSKDAVIFCVPINSLEDSLKQGRKHFKKGSLVIDVCSVKEYPIELLKKHVPKNVEYLATHPLFGPDSAYDSLENKKIVLCESRINRTRYGKIRDLLRKNKLVIIETTAKDHDMQIAHTLNLTHFLGRAINTMNLQQHVISTVGYTRLLRILDTVRYDTWELFKDMNKYNKYAEDVRSGFIDTIKRIDKKIKENNT